MKKESTKKKVLEEKKVSGVLIERNKGLHLVILQVKGGDDMSFVFWAIKWVFILTIVGVALYLAAIVAAIVLLLGPIILLSWYLIKKRNLKLQPIVGIILSAYFAFDFSFGGYITQLVGGYSGSLPLKYFGLLYTVILAVLVGLCLGRMSFTKFPSVSDTNFITKKRA